MLNTAFLMVAPFFAGCMMDLLIGDPVWRPKLTGLICGLIEHLDGVLRGVFPETPRGEKSAGNLLVLLVAMVSLLTAALLLIFARSVSWYLWLALETLFTFEALSVRRLRDDSAQLCEVLENKDKHGDLSRARLALSRMTSDETNNLNRREIVKAGVMGVSRGTTRNAVAPMLFLTVGGGAFGIFYKAVDSLRISLDRDNHDYRYIGMAASRLSNLCELVPSKLASFLMRISARLLRLDYDARPAETSDIARASRVMVLSSFLCAVLLGTAKFFVLYFIIKIYI